MQYKKKKTGIFDTRNLKHTMVKFSQKKLRLQTTIITSSQLFRQVPFLVVPDNRLLLFLHKGL